MRFHWQAAVLSVAWGMAALTPAQPSAPPLAVYAAGSLRAALTDVARAFEVEAGVPVTLTFGASGLLKERIEGGASAQVFASANMAHPQALSAAGKAEAALPFARNALCALAAKDFSLQGKTLAQRLLDADVRVGTSTPKADPSGDYAFEMFDRIESTAAAGAGSAAVLKAKALQLTGGPQSVPPPAGRSVYAMLVSEDKADVFITYCTNATQAQREVKALQILALPDPINVAATYGVALVRPVVPAAQRFVDFLRGAPGQRILAGYGFKAP